MDKSCVTNRLYRADGAWNIFKFEGQGSIYTDISRREILLHNIKRGNSKPGGKPISRGRRKVVCADVCKELFDFLLTFGLH